MTGAGLAKAIREEMERLRKYGKIPTEVCLGEGAWNAVSEQMTYGAFGQTKKCLFDGLPCILIVDMPADSPGFFITVLDPGGG